LDPNVLKKLTVTPMPYGKYAGRALIDLPEPYMMWMARQGFPKGELGALLALVYEIKLEGLEGFVKRSVQDAT
jgi:uncharacterized protein (DUF3820 family)